MREVFLLYYLLVCLFPFSATRTVFHTKKGLSNIKGMNKQIIKYTTVGGKLVSVL